MSMGASVLIAMLLSLPMAGDVQAAVSAQAQHRERLATPPIQVLGAEIVRNLCFGIRYEADRAPARPEATDACLPLGAVPADRPHSAPLLEALTDLPPPSVCL